MSVVIIGGNECMERQYKKICEKHKCKAKVFTRMKGNLVILFTATAAHKMVKCAIKEAQRSGSRIERIHSSSASALEGVLAECVAAN